MSLVRVYNDNKFTHTEQFKGDKITIAPGEFIEMTEEDAVNFRGQYFPIRLGGNDQPTPESYKMIRIVKDFTKVETKPEVTIHSCHACKYLATSEADLNEHIMANHKASILVDDEAELEIKKRKK